MRLKPPTKNATFNGTKIGPDGVEVSATDAEALKAAGWVEVGQAEKPRPKKTKAQPKTAEPAAENED